MNYNIFAKLVVVLLILIGAVLRVTHKDSFGAAIDETTLTFLVVAFVLLIIPWNKLASLKAGPLELEISELKETQQRLNNVTEDMASLVNRVEQSLIPIISGKNPHQAKRLKNDRALVIGSKEFTEQVLLGNFLANWINEKLPEFDLKVLVPNGGTLKNWADLTNGWIDGYIEYTGTGGMLLQRDLRGISLVESIKILNEESDKQGLNVEWLKPLGISNEYVIIMLKKNADALGVRTLKNLGKRGVGKLSFCCQMEFFNRPDGLGRLLRLYNANFASTKIVSYPDRYRLLQEGVCHMTASFRTDPELRELLRKELVVELEDSDNFFPQYHAIPVFSKEALKVSGLKKAVESMENCLEKVDMQSKIERYVNKAAFNEKEICEKIFSDIISA